MAGLQRIGTYLGRSGQFATLQEAADAMWAVSTGFGPHSAEQWLELSRHMVRPATPGDAAGPVVLHYDPRIAVPFGTLTQESALQGEAALWSVYDHIQARTLLLRGADSDLLAPSTAESMAGRARGRNSCNLPVGATRPRWWPTTRCRPSGKLLGA